jgi:hypothetical protein
MEELIHPEEWGDPLGYSITVNRKGENLETEYSVVPSPAKETPADIIQAYKDKPINLEALFTGGNPFDEVDGITHNSTLRKSQHSMTFLKARRWLSTAAGSSYPGTSASITANIATPGNNRSLTITTRLATSGSRARVRITGEGKWLKRRRKRNCTLVRAVNSFGPIR